MSYLAVLSPKSRRAPAWLECFGGLEIRVTEAEPHFATAPGFPNGARFFFAPAEALSEEQRDRLCRRMATQFGMSSDQVLQDWESRGGVPVLAEDVTIVDESGSPVERRFGWRAGAIDKRLL